MKPKTILLSLFVAAMLAACSIPGATGDTTPPPAGNPAYTAEWLANLAPDTVLLQLEYEPTFARMEMSYPFGRVPTFTLFADGLLVYEDWVEDSGGVVYHRVQMTAEDTLALVQEVMGAGFEGLENYLDSCMTQDDGSELCIADASFTILRATLSTGENKEVRSYANFSNDPAGLHEILLVLNAIHSEDDELYIPQRAAVFVSSMGGDLDVTLLDWPLDPALLQTGGYDVIAFVLEGEGLDELVRLVGTSYGQFYFQQGEAAYAVYLVPWLPHTDYSVQLAENFPAPGSAPTPEPVPEPVMRLADDARANLAGVLGIPENEITVVSIEEVEWPDGCLGIEYLDMACTDAIVPGFRLMLQANGQLYEYRSNLEGSLLLAVDPTRLSPGESGDK